MAMNMCCASETKCLATTNETPEMSAVATIEAMFVSSIQELQPETKLDLEDSAKVSKLIYDSMTTPGRVYHAMQHVFDISQSMEDPILKLSALFHDVVYYSIDKAFLKEQEVHLHGVLVEGAQSLTLSPVIEDEVLAKFIQLYGFTPGEALPSLGTNEFLSGVIGIRVLSKWLSYHQLMEVATCIEATIPFRPVIDGKSPMDRLYDRLEAVCPEQPEEWLVSTVQKAAATANFDLCSFDSDDRDFFLDASWKLLPEARPILLREDCPLLEWKMELLALEGRSKFLLGAIPKIFQSFRQVPTDEEMERKQQKARENLDVFREYTKIRRLQAMVLVEVVEAMGEDPASFPARACLSMDVPEYGVDGDTLADLTSEEKEIRKWLVVGRRICFAWDPAVSPLAGYLFDSLGTQGVEEALKIGNDQQPGSHELLKFLPNEVLLTITATLGKVFSDRADLFSQIPEKLGILAQ